MLGLTMIMPIKVKSRVLPLSFKPLLLVTTSYGLAFVWSNGMSQLP